jgi:hypothetical protein
MSASEYLRAASAKTQQISQLERDVQRPSIQQDFQQVATQSTAQAMVDQSPQASQLMLQKNRLDTSARSLQLKAMHAMMNGSAVQRIEDDEPLQSKFATTQLIEDDELLQGKFETVQRIEEDENALQGKFATIQRVDDEELLQGKFAITQRAEEDELLQGKFSTKQVQEQDPVKPNNTGLPNQLKAGIESLSGMSMDHVKVNYNSDKPAQLNAHAYAQGSEIHVAPGQEQHLPHEAWHVVQQAQGRVKPTMQMKQGVPVNDDVGLENEADVMGGKALQMDITDSATLQAKVYMGGDIVSNMQDVAKNNAAWGIYSQMGTPTRNALRSLLPGDHVFDVWAARGIGHNYFPVTLDQLNLKLKNQLMVWNALENKPFRYDTGYNGPFQPNEVVSQETCNKAAQGWSSLAQSVLGYTPTHQAWSSSNGAKTGKNMHDFLIQNEAGKSLFNFHIEVERGDPT